MSKRLGPIHYLVFERILFLRDLNNKLAALDTKIGKSKIEASQLEDCIDEQNIHESLQNMIKIVQEEHADILSKVYSKRTRNDIYEMVHHHGKAYPIEGTIEDVYLKFTKIFLYGMPCDRILSILEKDEDLISVGVKRADQRAYFNDPELWDWEQNILVNAMLVGYKFEKTIEGFRIMRDE